ncbi:MAG: class I SAM-dependent methyltransferase family protein [Candidatus Micrarchaeia archaeon]
MLYLKVLRKNGEKSRIELINSGNFKKGYKIISDKEFVYIPIIKKRKGMKKIVELLGEKTDERPKKLEEILEKKLTKEEFENLTTSYDIVGDIAIIEIAKGLEEKEKTIAEAILKIHPNIKTVVKKFGPVEGKFRTRKVKIIAGKNKKETIHREHECKFKLNVEKAYYSVRLSGERKRIEELVKPKEKILALFAGVGPYPVIIAKNHPKTEIAAVELNPDAVKYMKENIELNKIKNVEVILGDVNRVVCRRFKNWADRVIMPLPKSSSDFLESAIIGTKNNGIIHFYLFVGATRPFFEARKKIEENCQKAGAGFKIKRQRVLRSYAKDIVQVVVDFEVRK